MLREFLCWVGFHEWKYKTRNNHSEVVRMCKHCPEEQELVSANSIAPTDYWRSTK